MDLIVGTRWQRKKRKLRLLIDTAYGRKGGYMRKRLSSYEDYGLTKEEVEYIKKFCINANEEEKKCIKQALSQLDPYISPYVFYSLISKKSYEKIIAKDYIFMGKEDFYGHRRYGIYCIKDWLIINKMWKFNS